MNPPVTMDQDRQRLGRRVARVARELELARLAPQLAPGLPLEADLTAEGLGNVARVEVRHPRVERGGVLWLLGIVELIGADEARVAYAVPAYRPLLEHAVRAAGGQP